MPWITPEAGQEYAPLFEAATAANGLPEGLLSRVAYQESRYDPQAFNEASGASGMMQIVPRWHPGVDPFNPAEAIPYAARYLAEMFKRFGSWALARAAYNAGPGNVEKYGGIPPFQETQSYVASILRDLGELPGKLGELDPAVGAVLLALALFILDGLRKQK